MNKLQEKIEAMEAQINVNPSEDADIIKEPLPVPATEPEPVIQEQVKKPRTNWKKRFTNYKSSTDATIYDLRRDLARRSEEVLGMKKNIDDLRSIILKNQAESKKDALDSVLTEEDREILGNEAVDTLKKVTSAAVNNAVSPLKKELEEAKERSAIAEKDKIDAEWQKANLSFRKRLGKQIPDFEEINIDPNFMKYMDKIDPVSGYTKARLFKIAEHSGDVGRVASFFKEFKKSSLNEEHNQILDENITPVASNTSKNTGTDKTPISKEFIDNFYKDCIKGVYNGRESERVKINTKIDNALANGEIVM